MVRLKIIKKKFKDGLRVFHIKNNQKNIIVEIDVNAGFLSETHYDYGVAHILEHLIWDGSKNCPGEYVRQEIKKINGYYNSFTCPNKTSYLLLFPRKYFNRAIVLLSELLTKPDFNYENIAKEKQIVLRESEKLRSNPLKLCQEYGLKLLFNN